MSMRPVPGPDGDWSVEIGKGPTAFRRDGFVSSAEAQLWAEAASTALKKSTIRIGHKRISGTGAEALRRWAIDQGTLPASEGGTHQAPVNRLAPLMADPASALPLFALESEDLVGLRTRRLEALGELCGMLVEQAALAVAIDDLREFYLPDLDNPFHRPAKDGVFILEAACCAQVLSEAQRRDADLGRAVALILTTGLSPDLLLASHAHESEGRLSWEGGEVAWPAGLHWPRETDRPVPSHWTLQTLQDAVVRIGVEGLTLSSLWLTGLYTALQDGRHLDEALSLAGIHRQVAA